MRLVSLLPSATEIVYALGLGDDLVGVSAECDEPTSARRDKAVVVAGHDTSVMTPAAQTPQRSWVRILNRHALEHVCRVPGGCAALKGSASVEKSHAVAVGDRCRVDVIDEVIEEVLDPAGDGDDELARGTVDDVVAVRDAVG